MTIKTDNLQLGLSTTASNNFVMDANTPGVLKTGVGNFDSFTEVARVTTNGSMSRVIPGGSVLYPDFACRAWGRFSYSSTNVGGLNASGNVSSFVRNGIADYTVNFTTPMPDSNYSAVFGGTVSANAGNDYPNTIGELPYQA